MSDEEEETKSLFVVDTCKESKGQVRRAFCPLITITVAGDVEEAWSADIVSNKEKVSSRKTSMNIDNINIKMMS